MRAGDGHGLRSFVVPRRGIVIRPDSCAFARRSAPRRLASVWRPRIAQSPTTPLRGCRSRARSCVIARCRPNERVSRAGSRGPRCGCHPPRRRSDLPTFASCSSEFPTNPPGSRLRGRVLGQSPAARRSRQRRTRARARRHPPGRIGAMAARAGREAARGTASMFRSVPRRPPLAPCPRYRASAR